ncbi:hypothetical protein M9H77_25064 [Catharanthus roseus]|uniref:Uncharacterized protein n=1 Tax=Catharanthus roseus TaxID=4058 RepID=A0ACC0A6Q3_CATRO|nr:hypothetical protein M9H77_25064 [Catharanthus roseus]
MEEMMVMMMIRRPENPRIESISNDPITPSTFPTWKLYENPFYTQHLQNHPKEQHPPQEISSQKQIHRLHLPISARKIAASFWDLSFIRPFMESELDIARDKIAELKAELECERKARKKAESMNKKLARELSEERKGREVLERLCEELAKEMSSEKAEINKMKKDMEEERRMLRVAEVLREERVQMKLTEAKLLLEEKLSELEATKQMHIKSSVSKIQASTQEESGKHIRTLPLVNDSSGHEKRPVLVESSSFITDNNGSSPLAIQRKASPEPENPHISRGIKGFVEFPKVVRAIGSKSKHLGTKLECQKAQLRILLKQKTSLIRSNSLFTS